MAVGRPDHISAAGRRLLDQVRKQAAVLLRQGVADRVGQVDGGGAGLDDGLAQLDQEVAVRAARVLRRELDVINERPSERDHLGRGCQALGARDVELVLEVDVGRGEEGVDAVQRRLAHRLVAPSNVLLVRARQAGDAHRHAVRPALRHVARGERDALDGFEVALRGDREARLAYVHAQPRQLLPNLHLLVAGQRRSRGLLSVAQRRVKDPELLGARGRSSG